MNGWEATFGTCKRVFNSELSSTGTIQRKPGWIPTISEDGM